MILRTPNLQKFIKFVPKIDAKSIEIQGCGADVFGVVLDTKLGSTPDAFGAVLGHFGIKIE